MSLLKLLKNIKPTLRNIRNSIAKPARKAEDRRRLMRCFLLSAFCFLAACAPLPMTRPVTKLGLVAPFEGLRRATGYEILYAVKLAVREQNAAGGVAGWQVELVALNAEQSEQALQQASVLAVDPDVTFALALDEPIESARLQAHYQQLGLPLQLLALPVETHEQPTADFAARYQAISHGVAPQALAFATYQATQTVLQQIAQRIRAQGHPAR